MAKDHERSARLAGNILAGCKIACSDSGVSSCLFLKYVLPEEEINGECLLVGYVSVPGIHTPFIIFLRGAALAALLAPFGEDIVL